MPVVNPLATSRPPLDVTTYRNVASKPEPCPVTCWVPAGSVPPSAGVSIHTGARWAMSRRIGDPSTMPPHAS